jgi:hypothetical protein
MFSLCSRVRNAMCFTVFLYCSSEYHNAGKGKLAYSLVVCPEKRGPTYTIRSLALGAR